MKLEMIDSPSYKEGMIFKKEGVGEVMLCQIGMWEYQLICLWDGNRWSDSGRIVIPSESRVGKYRERFYVPDNSPLWGTDGRQVWKLIKEDKHDHLSE